MMNIILMNNGIRCILVLYICYRFYVSLIVLALDFFSLS